MSTSYFPIYWIWNEKIPVHQDYSSLIFGLHWRTFLVCVIRSASSNPVVFIYNIFSVIVSRMRLCRLTCVAFSNFTILFIRPCNPDIPSLSAWTEWKKRRKQKKKKSTEVWLKVPRPIICSKSRTFACEFLHKRKLFIYFRIEIVQQLNSTGTYDCVTKIYTSPKWRERSISCFLWLFIGDALLFASLG